MLKKCKRPNTRRTLKIQPTLTNTVPERGHFGPAKMKLTANSVENEILPPGNHIHHQHDLYVASVDIKRL
jgi:hypothetical protein